MIKYFNGLLFSNAKLINFQMIFKKQRTVYVLISQFQ